MQFPASSVLRFGFRTAIIAAMIAAPLLTGSASTVSAAQGGLGYNEVIKFVRADQPAPQPGSFTPDFQAAVDAQKSTANATQHHGMFGALMNVANAAKGALSIFQSGIASTNYYMNGWERNDNPGAQTATITRPDRHEIIYLNLAKKTYHVVDTNVQPVTQTPPPYQPPQNQGPQPSPQPGTGKLDVNVSSSILGPKTIESVQTTGYSQDFKLSETQSTGSCHDGNFEMSMVQYVSNYDVPRPPHANVKMSYNFTPPSPTAMAMHPGCSPKTAFHHSGGAEPPADKLGLWSLVTLKGNAQTNQGSAGGAFSTLIERGNVRVLGPSDAGLFDIPADYTKEQ